MDAVSSAFESVPREDFLPGGARRRAGTDAPIHIGHGQTNSQPTTVRNMLRLLDVRPGDRILDVGSGSGWTTGLLAELTGADGVVAGVELEPDLVELGAANLSRGRWPWASIEAARPGVLGLPEGAPYDRILVSADAGELPAALVDQLAPDGVMVIPVRGRMLRVVRAGDDVRVTEHGDYRFVPLR